MKIYTRTGDRGQTGLVGGTRVSKDSPRVRAYGEVDELNCAVGAALAALPRRKAFETLARDLAAVQEELFVVGAILASPPDKPAMTLPAEAAARLEAQIDRMTAEIEPLRQFILPGGAPAGAALHLARAVCRRAERSVVALGEGAPGSVVTYLNRLSDHLFTAARWINAKLRRAEVRWKGAP